ncbi:MAG: serine hydrolase domain-containing protein [Pseudomonadota bacterium]
MLRHLTFYTAQLAVLWFAVLGTHVVPVQAQVVEWQPTDMSANLNGAISAGSEGAVVFDNPPVDPMLLEAFVDGVAVSAMQDHRITGAVVAIVSSTETLLLKGYGLADAASGISVDPSEHLFRIASITKTFTATAIMQLVERGLLDLDVDIREYLDGIPIDDHLGVITIGDLLTHSAGFEDRFLGYYGPPPDGEAASTEAQLAAIAAIQVREPGTVTSYSNYSFTLLGEIIAQASGESYAEYVRSNILLPLGMKSSDVRLKTTDGVSEIRWLAELQSREARPHHWSGGWHEVLEPLSSRKTVQPEGGMSATGADMARYLKMHLNKGAYGGTQILSAASWEQMSAPLFRNGPYADANAHGFWTHMYSGYEGLNHGGSINEFKSMLVIVPELDLGFFISTNTGSGSKLRELPKRVIEHFYPTDDLPLPLPPGDFNDRASLYVGDYLGTRRNKERFDRIFTVFSGAMSVSSSGDGYLVFSRNGSSRRYVEVEPHVFESLEDRSRVQFKLDESGKVQWLVPSGGSQAFEPPEFFERPITLILPLASTLAVASGILLVALWRLFRRVTITAAGSQRVAGTLLRLGSAGWILVVVVFTMAVLEYLETPATLMLPFPSPAFVSLAYVLWAVALVSVACAALIPSTWKTSGGWSKRRKFGYSATSMLFLVCVICLYQWNAFLILK